MAGEFHLIPLLISFLTLYPDIIHRDFDIGYVEVAVTCSTAPFVFGFHFTHSLIQKDCSPVCCQHILIFLLCAYLLPTISEGKARYRHFPVI
jgi:hypothetical protein